LESGGGGPGQGGGGSAKTIAQLNVSTAKNIVIFLMQSIFILSVLSAISAFKK
jgi:hypothetical protein